MEDLLQGIHSLRELTAQTKDLVLSYGERCSTFMVSKIAAQHFPHAQFVNAADLIKTDNSFGHAKVNMELTEMLVRNYYYENTGRLLFVTGFISSNDAGPNHYFGSWCSDYTAAILGSALNASEIQVWTDVNGMMNRRPAHG